MGLNQTDLHVGPTPDQRRWARRRKRRYPPRAPFPTQNSKGTPRSGTNPVTGSVLNLFQANDDPRRFGPMRGQLRKVRIAPISKAYHLSVLSFHSRNLDQFQHVESAGVEEKGMMPEHFAELRDC